MIMDLHEPGFAYCVQINNMQPKQQHSEFHFRSAISSKENLHNLSGATWLILRATGTRISDQDPNTEKEVREYVFRLLSNAPDPYLAYIKLVEDVLSIYKPGFNGPLHKRHGKTLGEAVLNIIEEGIEGHRDYWTNWFIERGSVTGLRLFVAACRLLTTQAERP